MSLALLAVAILFQISMPSAAMADVLAKIRPLPDDSLFKFYEAASTTSLYFERDLYINNREARFTGLKGTLRLEPQSALPEWMASDEDLGGGVMFKVMNPDEFARQNPTYRCKLRWLVLAASEVKRWGGLGWFGSKESKDLTLYIRVTGIEASDVSRPVSVFGGICLSAPYIYYVPLSDYPLLREE